MKVYQSTATGLHYVKQADVPKGEKFVAVEFPFSASPKQDFCDWLNERGTIASLLPPAPEANSGFFVEPKATPVPNPAQPDPQFARQTIAFEDGFAAMPLATKLHFAALAVEEARERIKA